MCSHVINMARCLIVQSYALFLMLIALSVQSMSFTFSFILIHAHTHILTFYLSHRFEGELEGSVGLIPAAYVKHVKDWKALAAVHKPGPPSPQLARRRADSGGRAASAPMPDTSSDRVPIGRSPSPLVSRKAGSVGPVDSSGPASASRALPQPSESPSYGGLQLPGMGAGNGSARGSAIFRAGVSDDELIKPHKIAMQPDRPDLAKSVVTLA